MGKSAEDVLPFDTLAGINQDGSVTLLVVAPMVIVGIALVVIVLVRLGQRRRERIEMEASLHEETDQATRSARRPE